MTAIADTCHKAAMGKMLDPVRATIRDARSIGNAYGTVRESQADELARKRNQQRDADARTRGPGLAKEFAQKKAAQAAADMRTRARK